MTTQLFCRFIAALSTNHSLPVEKDPLSTNDKFLVAETDGKRENRIFIFPPYHGISFYKFIVYIPLQPLCTPSATVIPFLLTCFLTMKFLFAHPSVVVAKWLILALCLSTMTLTTFAQEDGGDTTTTNAEDDIDASDLDIPSTLQALSKECPMEMARIAPCIDTSTDLTACTECVSMFASQNADILNANNLQQGRQEETGNATTTNGTDTSTTTTANTCDDIQDALCKGIQQCGSSCGLVKSESVLTFGSDCEALFGNLVACVLQSQNIGTDCNFQDSSCLDGQVVAGNAAASIARRETISMITGLIMVFMTILSLWM
jgi:hypothetical protein